MPFYWVPATHQPPARALAHRVSCVRVCVCMCVYTQVWSALECVCMCVCESGGIDVQASPFPRAWVSSPVKQRGHSTCRLPPREAPEAGAPVARPFLTAEPA